jgi:hypothetical protein
MMVVENTNHPLVATQQQIAETRISLTKALEEWRKCQAIHSSAIRTEVLAQAPAEIEEERLFLPSQFSTEQRVSLGLVELGKEEAELREAQCCDAILQLRRAVKSLSAARGAKKKNDSGQKQNTRSMGKIQTMEFTRDYVLEAYRLCRQALLSLRGEGNTGARFPELTADDLYRKPTISKRELGDSHRGEGKLWVTLGGSAISESDDSSLHATDQDIEIEEHSKPAVVHNIHSADWYSFGHTDHSSVGHR